MITPIRQDKRFMLCAGTMTAVLLLCAFGRTPPDSILGFLAAVLAGYVGQSQWGQTRRTLGAPPTPALTTNRESGNS